MFFSVTAKPLSANTLAACCAASTYSGAPFKPNTGAVVSTLTAKFSGRVFAGSSASTMPFVRIFVIRRKSSLLTVSTPWTDIPYQSLPPTRPGIVPGVAFRVESPQHAAGIRSDPMPSLPCANGTIPAATAAADPPEDPPGVCPGRIGLSTASPGSVVVPHVQNCGFTVVPTAIAPALVNCWTNGFSRAVFSFSANGTPASGNSERFSLCSSSRAACRALSAHTSRKA